MISYTYVNDTEGIFFASSLPHDKSTEVKECFRAKVIYSFYQITKISEEQTSLELY